MTKKGLVMEGGAMRGLFTAGVIDVLLENGIEFDGAVGVSAGAVFGCNYKSKQVGRVLRYNTAYCKDPRYCSVRSLIRTGDMFGVDFCYRRLPFELDIFDTETFTRNPMEFYVVTTDAMTGEPVYRKCENGGAEDLEWFRASASMPLAARIVDIDGKKYLDGGISDSIPLEFFEKKGYEKNVVILTRPQGYIKKKNGALPLLRLALRKYPGIIRASEIRHDVYNAQTRYVLDAEKNGRAFVICPPEKLPIGRIEHNAENLKNVYAIGRKTAEERLGAVKAFLNT